MLELIDVQDAGSVTSGVRAVAVEYRDDVGNLAYALKQIKKDSSGRYQLVSWAPDVPAKPVDPTHMFTLARYLRIVEPAGRRDK